jgi:hypothetical protein
MVSIQRWATQVKSNNVYTYQCFMHFNMKCSGKIGSKDNKHWHRVNLRWNKMRDFAIHRKSFQFLLVIFTHSEIYFTK